jgi:hypothetical protein
MVTPIISRCSRKQMVLDNLSSTDEAVKDGFITEHLALGPLIAGLFFSGLSTTLASVVTSRPATDAASWSAAHDLDAGAPSASTGSGDARISLIPGDL